MHIHQLAASPLVVACCLFNLAWAQTAPRSRADCTISHVYVTVDKVVARAQDSTAGGPTEIETAISPPRTIDLAGLSSGLLDELGQAALPPGRYSEARLYLTPNQPGAVVNSVQLQDGTSVALETPRADARGWTVRFSADVPQGQLADVVLDFDACESVRMAGASGTYSLRPFTLGRSIRTGLMYWGEAGAHTISRGNKDGSDAQLLVQISKGDGPAGVVLDVIRGKMYWAEANQIRRANLDGSQIEVLVSGVGATGFALDVAAGKMYYSDIYVTGFVYRANLDGTGIETVIGTVGDRQGIALDLARGKIYWTQRALKLIQRANLDGSQQEVLVTGLTDPRGIQLDLVNGKMYWTDTVGVIQRANLDGSGVETLVTGLVSPSGIALDFGQQKFYWADFGSSKIQRADFSGANVQDLLTNLSLPNTVTLDRKY